MDKKEILKTVKDFYSAVARGEIKAADPRAVSRALYGATLQGSAAEADLGLGCGDPLVLGRPKEGDIMLDLGCGKGVDLYRALPALGPTGQAWGVDNNDAMLEGARKLKAKSGAANLHFIKGELDAIPLPDGFATLIVSNCVINLTPDKNAVYREIARLLAPGGRVSVSDIMVTEPLPKEIRQNPRYWGT